eukprot:6583812-Pyramimonas_sp.AAC.1
MKNSAREAALKGNWLNPDPMDGSTVHFKTRVFLGYVERKKNRMKEGEAFSIQERGWLRHLAGWFLDGDAWEYAEHFIPLFDKARGIDSSLVPKMAAAFSTLYSVPLTTGWVKPTGEEKPKEVGLTSFGLSPGDADKL